MSELNSTTSFNPPSGFIVGKMTTPEVFEYRRKRVRGAAVRASTTSSGSAIVSESLVYREGHRWKSLGEAYLANLVWMG